MNTGMNTHGRGHSGLAGVVIAILMILLILLGLTPGRFDGNTETNPANASGGVSVSIFDD